MKFEHADQEILGFVSPMPKVYVDILEKWEDSMIAKGIPKKVKELQLNTELYEECILSAFQGKEWKPKPVKFNMFRIVPHTHEVATIKMEKKIFVLYNPKVIFNNLNWTPEEGDLQTLALGHTDIKPEEMFDLEPQRKQWLKENTFATKKKGQKVVWQDEIPVLVNTIVPEFDIIQSFCQGRSDEDDWQSDRRNT